MSAKHQLSTQAPMYLGEPGRFASSLNELAPPRGTAQFHTLEDRYQFCIRMAFLGCNYLVGYKDSGDNGPYGVSYAYAHWVGPNQVYYKDLHGLIH